MLDTSANAENKHERFLRLLRPAQDRLESFALAMTRNIDEARDLVGETILRAYETFDDLRNPGAFASYLLTIASRLHRRRWRKRRLFDTFDQDHAESMPDNSSSPDARVDVDVLYDALSRLPDAQRETVVLFEISGLSLEEIQRVQGGSLSGVKSRLVRGRERLAQMLGDDSMTFDVDQALERINDDDIKQRSTFSQGYQQ